MVVLRPVMLGAGAHPDPVLSSTGGRPPRQRSSSAPSPLPHLSNGIDALGAERRGCLAFVLGPWCCLWPASPWPTRLLGAPRTNAADRWPSPGSSPSLIRTAWGWLSTATGSGRGACAKRERACRRDGVALGIW